ncbi:hypothetical protein PISMIDRAFT_24227 [Pisolithus microcarpus 441]|uniref:Uncharacterized protein n=1 Tax=Pisolithus microcarpus 441 TaxID=765257 RepID=A0A0C9YTW6_9AGAM|nr:hypothetical protein BKA83DRAFT_24227 [Pisolithus microcarpus]KIK20166.1 hypothetical protein PISMIDRAFT_24227 [Pisolithus microcarpus 441]
MTGRVLLEWLRLYQNNLYIHLHSQVKACSPPPKPAPPTTTPSPSGAKAAGTHPKPEGLTATKVDRLWTELHALKEKFYKYIASHEACCHHSNSPSEASEEEALPGGNDPPPATSTTPPFTLLSERPDGVTVLNSNPPQWLTTVLNCLDLPPEFSGPLYSPDSNSLNESSHPLWAVSIVKLHFRGSSPFYLVVCGDKSLHISSTTERSAIATTIKLPPDPTIPTACH